MSHRLEHVVLALPMEVGGVTLYKTYDGKAHASSLCRCKAFLKYNKRDVRK